MLVIITRFERAGAQNYLQCFGAGIVRICVILEALFALGRSGSEDGGLLVNAANSEAPVLHPTRVKCRAIDSVSLLSRPKGKTLEFKRYLSSLEDVFASSSLIPGNDRLLLISEPVDTETNHISGAEIRRRFLAEPDAWWGTSGDNVSWKQRHKSTQIADKVRNSEYHGAG